MRRRRRTFQVCYIASHGQRRKLVGIGDKVIRLETLVDHCRPSPSTGYIFGACDFVTPDTAQNFLLVHRRALRGGLPEGDPVDGVHAGGLPLPVLPARRHHEVGAHQARRAHARRCATLEDFEITRSENPQKVAGQLYRDFPLAHDITFSCFTLDRGRGRKPAMVNSFDIVPPERGPGAPRWSATLEERPMAAGEAPIKQAVKWIDEQLQDNPERRPHRS